MTETPTDDQPGLVAERPEHCHDCYRLIRPGQRYFLTIEQAVVCSDCVRTADAIHLAGGLTVEVREDGLLVRRGSGTVQVLPHEVRHVVEAAATLVNRQAPEGIGDSQPSRLPASCGGWLAPGVLSSACRMAKKRGHQLAHLADLGSPQPSIWG
jgi:hypothetical protein